ncbi:hypothetical protein R3P38DRAFT_3132741 [Favolaschia claudopus]|uniref:Uncharacterized protein n=1 Tax=Favolaschia claudopus TaxID=2862362 RepID=A0AAV9Z8A6_9AGAR
MELSRILCKEEEVTSTPLSNTLEALPDDEEKPPSQQEPRSLPSGWESFVHLNGGMYYTCSENRLVTTDDIYDEGTLQRVLQAFNARENGYWPVSSMLQVRARISDLEMSISHTSGELRVSFVSWDKCEIYGYVNNDVVHRPKSAFWDHLSTFPMHRTKLNRQMEVEFLSALAFGSNERILENKATTFPYEDAQIERLIRTYADLRGPVTIAPTHLVPPLTYHIARSMIPIEVSRERYKYGTREARFYRDVAIPEPTWDIWIWDLFLGVILCGTPKNYRVRLQATIPNGIVALPEFRTLMRNLMSEWADSNLVATVLVSVTVGFLAVPDITNIQRTFALISSLCAMTSIVTGLHHVWQHREKIDIEKDDAYRYLHYLDIRQCLGKRSDIKSTDGRPPIPNLTLSAALLALPLATLQWSVLSFTLAIATYALQFQSQSQLSDGDGNSDGEINNGGSHLQILFIFLLSLLGALALCVFLFFWRIWAPPLHREAEDGHDNNLVWVPKVGWFVRAVRKLMDGVGMRQGGDLDVDGGGQA